MFLGPLILFSYSLKINAAGKGTKIHRIGLGKVQLLPLVSHDETREEAKSHAGARAAEVVFVHVSPLRLPSCWAALLLLQRRKPAKREVTTGRPPACAYYLQP
jgi:hypothetical protein